MEVKDLVIELIKFDRFQQQSWEEMSEILDEDFLGKLTDPEFAKKDAKRIETIIMDFIGIPKDESVDLGDEGYCRDCISEDYGDLRDNGEYGKAYQVLEDEAKIILEGRR